MTSNKRNSLLGLFASVQLALLLLFLLAATSIVGTLIPQNAAPSLYVEKYGIKAAQLMQVLSIPDMYNSWWFLGLLGLFALNLIVCSLDRIPRTLRIIRRDGLELEPAQVRKFPLHRELTSPLAPEAAMARVEAVLAGTGRVRRKETPEGRLFFTQQGAWTRLGVYVVHCSILIVLAGALLGSSLVARSLLRDPQFAFKGSLMLPEGESTGQIRTFKGGLLIDLGFQIRCDSFSVHYYDNGTPKTYLSRVTILENNEPVRTAEIKVNQPLVYKGVTFYQSSYNPLPYYKVRISREDAAAAEHTAVIPVARQFNWDEAGVGYGILNREYQGEATRRLKIWFSDQQGTPASFWTAMDQPTTLQQPTGTYRFTVSQLYATGLQATKDPGVGLVYVGCILMLAGLVIAFFMSHRRIYVLVQPDGNGSRLLFAGDTNKKQAGFKEKFAALIQQFEE
ncbi:MAG: cytochrome c biogenesis protein ResB [Desulfobulbus sp.]|jgi:cytochrome c biogenesis protein